MYFHTLPLPIIDLPAAPTHFIRGRMGFRPRYITIHHTGGTDSSRWLSRSSRPAVSTHRLIMPDGANYKIVADEDTAFTAGYGIVGPTDPDTNDPAGVAPNFNYESLHIELENPGNGRTPYPAAQMEMAARQVVEWYGRWGFLGLVGHSWVDSRKNDPAGFDWPWFYRLIKKHLRAALALEVNA